MFKSNKATSSAIIQRGLLGPILLSCALSCSHKSEDSRPDVVQPAPLVKAEPEVHQSLLAVSLPDLGLSGLQLRLQKSALEKEFLLMGSLVPQFPVPMFSGLKSRVVAFRQIENKIYMLEANQGHIISKDLPTHLLLASFNITQEDQDSVVFDFNSGMSQILLSGDWYSSDEDGLDHKYNLKVAKIHTSYIESASEVNNNLVLRQVSQVEPTDGLQSAIPGGLLNIEVKYYLSPYNPDKGFIPRRSPGLDKVGFFEASPLVLHDGSSLTYASKWNEKKQITYAISANTPERLRPAIRDGILYWNKILGKDHIQVIQLTDSHVVAPDPQYNIIQWVDWDLAEYAYADAQMDPRSGEILHAQIFFTSVFDMSGRRGFISRVRYLLDPPPSKEGQQPASRLLGSALCHRQLSRQMKVDLSNFAAAVSAGEISDAALEKANLDYIREVIAHEVGHTLGLRHNFAGNLAANYTYLETPQFLKSYVTHLKAPDNVIPSSSIMDYEAFTDSLIAGDHISDPTVPAASYDQAALEILYQGKSSDSPLPLFCTDSDSDKYFDCNVFDSGRSVIEDSMKRMSAEDVAKLVLNTYIAAKAPNKISELSKPVEEVNLDAEKMAQILMKPQYKLIHLFDPQTKWLKIRKLPGGNLSINQKLNQTLEQTWTQEEVTRLGGVEKILAAIPPDFASATLVQFDRYLQAHSSGREGEKSYEFSAAEKLLMVKNVTAFLPVLEKALRRHELNSLSGKPMVDENGKSPQDDHETGSSASSPAKTFRIADQDLSFELAKFLGQLQFKYLFSKSDKTLTGEVITTDQRHQDVILPVYSFPQELRLLSLGLLSQGRSEAPEWGLAERAASQGALESELAALKFKNEEIAKDKLSREVARWLLNNLALLKDFVTQ